ncbi:MAG: spermidine/putrescine ABC transporter substrate-binding protein [Nanoarchaeota archaeon]|nr:spermidine/putrescine ABC transporter substrate-binding protein [Nanoarchaeota archaeon]
MKDNSFNLNRFLFGSTKKKLILGFLIIILLVGVVWYVDSTKLFGVKEVAIQQEKVREVVLYNWEEYTDLSILEDFEKEYGIKVRLEEYGQAFEMTSSLYSDSSRYDIVVTDGHSITALAKARLLAELDFDKLPNFIHINPEFKDLYFDPENKYYIPYLFGTTGLGVNTKFVTEPITSWNDLYDPKYKGKIALLDDPREVMTVVLQSMGVSTNTRDVQVLKDAEKKANQLKENDVILSDYFPLQQELIDGDKWIVMAYSGDLLKATQDNPEIVYILPEEGSTKWLDNYVILAQSKNIESAHLFLNFVMRPEIAARISNSQFYASPNKDAKSMINSDILSNPIIYPSESELRNSEYILDAGESQSEYNRIYSLIK